MTTTTAFRRLAEKKGWVSIFEYLPRATRDWLYRPVRDGHGELFRTCCILRQIGIEDIEPAAEIIAARWLGYERMPEAREIEDAWEASEGAVQEESDAPFTRRPPVRRDEDAIRKILDTSPVTLRRITELSRVPLDDLEKTPASRFILDLFPSNSLICLGQSAAKATISHLDTAAGKAVRHPLIVPSPMTSTKGKNKRGKLTTRCLDNTGPRLYSVVEFDTGSFDDQAKMIAELDEHFPDLLTMVVYSGGKSLHTWFKVDGDEALHDRLFDRAVSLGADPMTRVACQFVRTPNARRDNGKIQQVLWYGRS